MQVILIQDVNNLGGFNEVVSVKSGYARNYLIPQKLAVEASPSNMQQLNERLKQQQKKEAKMLADILASLRRERPEDVWFTALIRMLVKSA